MKKTITILLSMLMILSLAACGNSENQTEQTSSEENSVENSTNDASLAESDIAPELYVHR